MVQLLKFIRLPGREKALFFNALYLLATYRIRLQVTSTQHIFNRVQRLSREKYVANPSPVPPQRIARLLNVAALFIPYSTCLSKSLAGQILFAGHGHKTRLHIGVANDAQQNFEAHAWLSLDDIILIGRLPGLERYREFPSLDKTSLK